ncbi:MAG: glycosyltransferase family 2 protein [bacterium]
MQANEKETVCAIVVTYQRKELLLECLQALRSQEEPLDAIYLVDNASSDQTPETLMEKRYLQNLPPDDLKTPWEKTSSIHNSIDGRSINLHYMRMPRNTGGSGGFYEGLKRAREKGYDWFWLMDDDTIPSEHALQNLTEKVKRLPSGYRLGFACSKVIWEGKAIHKMNIPQIQPITNGLPFNELEDEGMLIVKGASFVSLLIHRDVVGKVGYPIRQLFIWGDDIEYTGRIINAGYIGLYVRESTVRHKTKDNYQVNIFRDTPENAWKYYYDVRNKLFMEKQHGLSRYISAFIKNISQGNLKLARKRKSHKLKFIWTNTLASFASLIFNPHIK